MPCFDSHSPFVQTSRSFEGRLFCIVWVYECESNAVAESELAESIEVRADDVGDFWIAADGLPVHAEHDRLAVVRDLYGARRNWFGCQFAQTPRERLPREANPHAVAVRLHEIFAVREFARIEKPIVLWAGECTNENGGRRWRRANRGGGDRTRSARQRLPNGDGTEPRTTAQNRGHFEAARHAEVCAGTFWCAANFQNVAGFEVEANARFERSFAHDFSGEWSTDEDRSQLRFGSQRRPRETDFQGNGGFSIPREPIAERMRFGVGRTADGHAEMPRPRSSGIDEQRMQA